ncbi:MAG: SEL1-like repeat protein [Betaproteobacteria bacterium]|nr:SEL1-like repeat protein [Betaproteobacteria bacterium]
MYVRFLQGAFALLLLAGFSCPAPAQTRSWMAAAIANQPAANVRLLGAKGDPVAIVRRELVQQLLAVLDRIQRPGGFAGELIITDGNHPNAFALSARGRSIIGITAPMLDLLGDDLDAYAALLGHEIAHHVRQHGAERRSREQALGAVSAIVGLILGAAGVQGGATIADFGRLIVSRSFSRDEEREADRLGVEWMAATGFDPEGALRLHERLLRAGAGGAIPFLQTHPSGEERVDNIRRHIASLAPSGKTTAGEIRAWTAQMQYQPLILEVDAESRQAFARGRAAYREKDFEAARREWLQASNGGHPDAQYGLGVLYAQGQGVAQDYAAAVEWYRKAADRGHRAAQNNLGVMHEKGSGVAQDTAAAVEWYRKAAGRGYPPAQNNLGRLHLNGIGVTADPLSAYMWFSLAAVRGHTGAARNRLRAAEKLSAEDVARAEKMVRDWKPDPVATRESPQDKPAENAAGDPQAGQQER